MMIGFFVSQHQNTLVYSPPVYHSLLSSSNQSNQSPSSSRYDHGYPSLWPSRVAWNLPNGQVQFDIPLEYSDIVLGKNGWEQIESERSSSTLWDPTLLGSGGSGAVFSFSVYLNQEMSSNKIAIKVSWSNSRDSVENECRTLQNLEKYHVPHLEKCIGRPRPYPFDNERVMIVLSPVVSLEESQNNGSSESKITSSIVDVDTGYAQKNAVKCVVETMVGMLSANIVTVDVQPLIVKATGEVLFIDFTEARDITKPLTALDEATLVGFCTEMLALIPDFMREWSVEYLKALLIKSSQEEQITGQVLNILQSIWIDSV